MSKTKMKTVARQIFAVMMIAAMLVGTLALTGCSADTSNVISKMVSYPGAKIIENVQNDDGEYELNPAELPTTFEIQVGEGDGMKSYTTDDSEAFSEYKPGDRFTGSDSRFEINE